MAENILLCLFGLIRQHLDIQCGYFWYLLSIWYIIIKLLSYLELLHLDHFLAQI